MSRSSLCLLLSAVLLLPFVACSNTGDEAVVKASPPTARFDGVFEYMLDGSEGLSFYQDGYFVHFLVPKGMEVPESGLTDPMVAEWWAGANLESGTYTVSGDTTTCTFLYHRDPSRVGESFQWVGAFTGDTLTWRVLDEQGAVQTVGRSLRLR